MTYQGKMDPECVPLCDAINLIPGLRTVESCCGHGKKCFQIWFKVTDPKEFPTLLYYLDSCHTGFTWHCKVKTDCAMAPVTYYLESLTQGEEAYRQANEIAVAVTGQLSGYYVKERKTNARRFST